MKVKDNISRYSRNKMLDCAKILGLRGYSKKNKQELAEAIADKILTVEYMKSTLIKLDDEGMECIEKLADGETIDFTNLVHLCDFALTGYVIIDTDNETITLCSDVGEVFRKCCSEEFLSEQRLRTKVQKYCTTFSTLYGAIPLDKAFEIYDKQNHDLSKEKFISFVKFAGEFNMNWDIYNDSIVADDIIEYDEYDEFVRSQGNIPYYIPSRKKIMKYADGAYFEKTNEYMALKNYLLKKLNLEEFTAENIAEDIEAECELDYDLEDMDDVFARYGVYPDNRHIEKLVYLIEELDYNVRKRLNRGFTLRELEEQEEEAQDAFFRTFPGMYL